MKSRLFVLTLRCPAPMRRMFASGLLLSINSDSTTKPELCGTTFSLTSILSCFTCGCSKHFQVILKMIPFTVKSTRDFYFSNFEELFMKCGLHVRVYYVKCYLYVVTGHGRQYTYVRDLFKIYNRQ